MNEDDLYGDLNFAAAKPTSSSVEPTASSTPPTSHPDITKLQEQITKLEAENATLKKNMGILYRTAKSELERKDRRMEELQNDLDAPR